MEDDDGIQGLEYYVYIGPLERVCWGHMRHSIRIHVHPPLRYRFIYLARARGQVDSPGQRLTFGVDQ